MNYDRLWLLFDKVANNYEHQVLIGKKEVLLRALKSNQFIKEHIDDYFIVNIGVIEYDLIEQPIEFFDFEEMKAVLLNDDSETELLLQEVVDSM